MEKKQVVTFEDSWPWGLILVFITGATIKAILYAVAHKFDETGFLVLGLTVGTFYLLTAFRYTIRALWVIAWNNAYQTKSGIAIIPNDVINVPLQKVEQICNNAAAFWGDWATRNLNLTAGAANSLIATAFSGATILCSSKVIVGGTPWWNGKFVGIQDGQNIYVVYDKKIIGTEADFLQLVKHEVSHLCLTALGVDPGSSGSNHHAIFAQTDYC